MIIKLRSQTDLSGYYICFRDVVHREQSGQYGLSHLMEHLMCKLWETMFDEFTNSGIYFNAVTDDSYVMFYLTGLQEYVSKYKDTCRALLTEFDITEEQLEIEKKVVLEEYQNYFACQPDSHFSNLFRKLYSHYGPIGLRGDLENITLKDCQVFFNQYFSEPDFVIDVSKYNSHIKVPGFVSKEKFIMERCQPISRYLLEIGNEFTDQSSMINLSPIIKDDFPYIEFLTEMLATGLESPLVKRIREELGLVYYIKCDLYVLSNHCGVVVISTETSHNNITKIYDNIEDVLSNPEEHLTEKRFNIIKNYYRIVKKKRMINRYEDIVDYLIDERWEIDQILDDLTLDKLMEIYKIYFNFEDYYHSVDQMEFKK